MVRFLVLFRKWDWLRVSPDTTRSPFTHVSLILRSSPGVISTNSCS